MDRVAPLCCFNVIIESAKSYAGPREKLACEAVHLGLGGLTGLIIVHHTLCDSTAGHLDPDGKYM